MKWLRGLVEWRAREAAQDKDEADAAAQAEIERIQANAAAELEAARAQASQTVADLQAAAAAELDHARAQAQQRIDAAAEACTRAQADAEHAQRQVEASAAEVSRLRAELAQLRTDSRNEQARIGEEARSDREALRAQYAEQLTQIQQSADARATALTQALEAPASRSRAAAAPAVRPGPRPCRGG